VRNPALNRALAGKAAPPQSALTAGFKPYPTIGRSAAADTRKLSTLMGTYGGTEDGVVWVYACAQLVMSELAAYPYEILTPGNRVLPDPSIPPDLKLVLDEPNEEMTYFDFMEFKTMDEELAGNSYWLKDDTNGLGQPLALRRLRPEFVKIAVNDQGLIIGYVYTVGNLAIPIPYERDEVIHFKRPSPLSEYYGMGTVEAIQRTLQAELAQTDHVIGFFSDGARISGVLTTGTLSEIQFERFKQQFYEEYMGDANAHKILIAEEGTKFEPIVQNPGGTGLTELRKMSKDEILSAFGVPAPLLGGVLDDANHKIDDSQHIFSRKMIPRARRTSEKITRDLVALWRVQYRVNVTYSESRTTKIEHAQEMLKGGASVNESRHAMDLPPFQDEWADVPVIPQGFAPFGFMTSGGAPQDTPVSEGGRVNGNNPKYIKSLTTGLSLPEWYEIEAAEAHAADPKIAAETLRHHGLVVVRGTETMRGALGRFLTEQRDRLVRAVGQFTGDTRKLNGRRGLRDKKELSIEAIWSVAIENTELLGAYRPAVNEIGTNVLDTPLFATSWEDEPRMAKAVADRLMERVLAVNGDIKERVAELLCEGNRRSYSIQQIANGNQAEGYPGLVGLYDSFRDDQLDTIARAEAVTTVNLAMLGGHMSEGTTHVEVFDGASDPACREAQGSVWEIRRALREPLAHPSCTRAFAPVP
jgi:HK97 family phage portal protein